MPGYDKWKTRSPDDDLGDEYEQPTPEQERADWEDHVQQQPRFFIDHGMIHDRLTGKHVTTEPDSQFCDGIQSACEMLNALAERRETMPLKLRFSNDWLREKILTDPDIETDNR